MMVHEFPCGIDRFNHTSYQGGEGYAFQLGKPLIPDVQAIGVPLEAAQVLCHNFIETGVEFHVLQAHPELPALLSSSVRSLDINRLAKSFATFYGTPPGNTLKAVKDFNHFLVELDCSTLDGLVQLWETFVWLYLRIKIDPDKTRQVIQRSIELTRTNHQSFLDYVIKTCKEDVKPYL